MLSLNDEENTPLDWNVIYKLAHTHHIRSALFSGLKKCSLEDSIPQHILKKLEDFHVSMSQKNLLLLNEIYKIKNIFGAHNISWIPLKGVILAKSVYDTIQSRECNDIDIICPLD